MNKTYQRKFTSRYRNEEFDCIDDHEYLETHLSDAYSYFNPCPRFRGPLPDRFISGGAWGNFMREAI